MLLAAGSVAALAPMGRGLSSDTTTSCTAPSLAGQQVQVALADMGGTGGMMGGRLLLRVAPRTVAAGTVSFIAANHGVRIHELLVLALPDDQAAGSRPVSAEKTVDETGSLGEASRSCGAGHGDGITRGQAGWVTLTLRPGRYELLCNQPGHYVAGMFSELDVT